MIFTDRGRQISKTNLPQALLGCLFCYVLLVQMYIYRKRLLYWDMTPFSFANHYPHFEKFGCLHIQGCRRGIFCQENVPGKNSRKAKGKEMFARCECRLSLCFPKNLLFFHYPEYGCNRLHRNFDIILLMNISPPIAEHPIFLYNVNIFPSSYTEE